MAHQIMGQRFIARAKPAWHNIAKRIFGEDEVSYRPAGHDRGGRRRGSYASPLWYKLDGIERRGDNKTAIISKPTADDPRPLVLGISSRSVGRLLVCRTGWRPRPALQVLQGRDRRAA